MSAAEPAAPTGVAVPMGERAPDGAAVPIGAVASAEAVGEHADPGTLGTPQEQGGRRRFAIGMGAVFAAVWAVGGWLAAAGPLYNSSFLWHLKTGHWILEHGFPRGDIFSFTAPGSVWVAQSWLAEVCYAVLDGVAGPTGIRVLDGVTGALIACFAYQLARRLTRDHVTAVALTLPAVLASAMAWVSRPLFLAIVAMLALVWIVEIPESFAGRRPLLFVPLVLWLWVNLHGTWVLGFGYLGLHVAGRWLDGAAPHRGRERRLVQATLVAAGACLVNPYGLGLITFPFRLMARDDILRGVVEWQSPDFRAPLGMLFGAWIAIACCAFALAGKRPSRRDVIVSVAFVLLGLWAQRNIAVATLVGLPVAARLFAAARPRPDLRARSNALIAAGLVLAGGLWTVRAFTSPAFAFGNYPVAALRVVDQQGLLGRRLLTTDLWAGYVIHEYWPEQRVFFDDRYDMYPVALTNDYIKVWNADPTWQQILDRHRLDVIVWPSQSPLTQLLAADPGWTRIHRDGLATVFTRRSPG